MDITGLSSSLLPSPTGAAQPGQPRTPSTLPVDEAASSDRRSSPLAMLRQEVRAAISAAFRLRFASIPVYADIDRVSTPADLAAETLGAARQAVAERPIDGRSTLVSFRERVDASAAAVQRAVGPRGDLAEIDDAVERVGRGLERLDAALASYRESSASVLAIEQRSRQRSTIRIQTQEGDVVAIDLKRVDRLAARDVFASDGDSSLASTEVRVSSRSRLVMRVEGNLNDEENAAIRNVLAQAEAIAEEFYGGDIAAAFDLASSLAVDNEQLAAVGMNFRSRQVTNVSYAEAIRRVAVPQAEGQPVRPASFESLPAERPAERPVEALPVSRPAVVERPESVAAAKTPGTAPPELPLASAIESFFDTLSKFLRSVGEGFEGEGAARYQYSESFKLSLLRSVFSVAAPAASDDAARLADRLLAAASERDDD